ncbi:MULTISPECIES: hypothetical protein [unclassified Pseudomonas]|uniref:hypothetical protein n=1 Tax=unclassified Pseudomonas TaxID=196821 RepID=UPI00351A6F98
MNKPALRKKAVSVAWVFGVLLIIDIFPETTLVFLGLVVICGLYDLLRNGLYDAPSMTR